jgi:hydrogenase maturation protein HypF
VSDPAAGERVRARVRIEGIVQGVGFRPFVHGLATSLALSGFVGNDAQGVFAEVEGAPAAVEEFLGRVRSDPPPLAMIERVQSVWATPSGAEGFTIVDSPREGERQTLISPDTATCDDCLRELFDPNDRRYRYPFINCTNCGPRFTIVKDVPYDRPFTTMAGFELCEACSAEYHDPSDRRFHAQPTCCPACGPSLRLVDSDGTVVARGDEALREAVRRLGGGAVVAVKGLGGYHLAADAGSDSAVSVLRARKHREDKAFAVIVPSIEWAAELAQMDDDERAAMASIRRPIVLVRRRAGAPLTPSVAPGNRHVGLMLPYSPLHHLLARDVGQPLVLTSGNVSDEPIAYRDDDAFERLRGIADAFLAHDRSIHMRTDDSVVRVLRGCERPIRRSRGYVPQPIPLPWPFPRHVLACGAELKNTFCGAKESWAFVSHHIGDLENAETLRSFTEGIEHFCRIFDIAPEVVAYDLHPEYLSTKYALDLRGVDQVEVQHHHAHIASCLADNGEAGPVIGVAFDGTGYGTDGTIWGGEFLVADLEQYERLGHFGAVPMPGGAAAIREPWRMAAAYLDACLPEGPPDGLAVVERNRDRWHQVVRAARAGVNSPPTSSAGRLFDAVAALCDVRDLINYEGQAAVELEQLADPDAARGSGHEAGIEADSDGTLVISGADLVAAVVADLMAGVDRRLVAARFHAGIRDAIVRVCRAAGNRTGLSSVALSGGVFQNLLLETTTVDALRREGLTVLTHSRVPPNDGGISLGQAAVAGARDRAAR